MTEDKRTNCLWEKCVFKEGNPKVIPDAEDEDLEQKIEKSKSQTRWFHCRSEEEDQLGDTNNKSSENNDEQEEKLSETKD